MEEFAKKFYKSRKWQKCRDSYLRQIMYRCERCGGIAVIVHHKIYLTPDNINDPEITLNAQYLEGLCKDCHNKEHFEKYMPTRGDVKFDDEGNIIEA